MMSSMISLMKISKKKMIIRLISIQALIIMLKSGLRRLL